jgi:hypothetical protein
MMIAEGRGLKVKIRANEGILGLGLLVVMAGVARAQTAQPTGALRLADGTVIRLRLEQMVSSANARVGDKVQFRTVDETRVDRVPVIPKGSSALGTVTAARRKRRMGRGGQLDVTIDTVRLADGEQAPLRSTERSVGEGKGDAVTGGVVASALVFWPAAPAFLLIHGEDVTMPEGTEITAYVEGDVELDASNFPPPRDYGPASSAGHAVASAPTTPPPAPPLPVERRPDPTYPGYVTLPRK